MTKLKPNQIYYIPAVLVHSVTGPSSTHSWVGNPYKFKWIADIVSLYKAITRSRSLDEDWYPKIETVIIPFSLSEKFSLISRLRKMGFHDVYLERLKEYE